MAILWGSTSGNLQVGIDVSQSPSTVTKDTASVTLTWQVWTRSVPNYEFFSDNVTLVLSGAVSESINYNNNGQKSTPILRATRSISVPTSYAGSVSRQLVAQVTGMFNGGNPSCSRTATVAKRPPQVPSAPTSATAVRNSDTQHTVSWVRPANWNSDSNAWATVEIRRKTNNGSWATVRTQSAASGTSWVDTTVQANNSYQYAVRAVNVSGASGFVYTATNANTPAAPSNVVATKLSNGNIQVSWTDNANADVDFEVQDETTPLATVSASPYTHVSPSTVVTHRYRVRAKIGSLFSAWSPYSNTVQLAAPPSAPTQLSPSGEVIDTQPPHPAFTWRHNPTDSSEQTAYQIRYRVRAPGGSFGEWIETAKTNSTSQSSTLLWAVTYPALTAFEWQVRTWGVHDDPGPYSAVAAFTMNEPPIATVTSPTDAEVVDSPSVTVTWSYYHPAGSAASAWNAEILQGGVPIASRSQSGSGTSWNSGNVLQDGGSYVARVRVREATGMWSAWDNVAFTVEFVEPLPPEASAEWQPDEGNTVVTASAQSDGVAPETVSLMIERSIEGGPWVLLAEDLEVNTEFYDWTAPSAGSYAYRVSAVSALPSTASTEVYVDLPVDDSCDLYLSGGPGFTQVCRLRYRVERTVTTGRERTLHHFAGRADPVEFSGIRVSEQVAVSAITVPHGKIGNDPTAQRRALEELFSYPGPHLYRSSSGRRMFVSLSPLQISAEYMGALSFTATKAGGGTVEQLEAIASYVGATVVEPRLGEYTVRGGNVQPSMPGEYEVVE